MELEASRSSWKIIPGQTILAPTTNKLKLQALWSF